MRANKRLIHAVPEIMQARQEKDRKTLLDAILGMRFMGLLQCLGLKNAERKRVAMESPKQIHPMAMFFGDDNLGESKGNCSTIEGSFRPHPLWCPSTT